MRIINEALLKKYRGPGRCEVCRQWCKKREACHVFSAGAGRLDIDLNLVSCGLTRKFYCACHSANHQKTNGRTVSRQRLLEIVAEREGMSVDAIVAEIHRLRRLPQPRERVEESLVKRKKTRSKWQEKAAELRRAAWRAAYQRMKLARKAAQRG